ncbi:family 43 glycosylhydrolase [bacterium]|nr:family 43 glycosylhydrolase [bacterium]
MTHRKTALCLLFWILNAGIHGQTGSVTNVHDPCMTKCKDRYFVYCTSGRITILRSKDMDRWEYMGSVFRDIPAWGVQEVPGVSNIWAPDISFYNGLYHLYYSLSTFGSNRSRIGLATNVTLDLSDPGYEWVDQGKVIESNPGDTYNAIDPNIVRDADGRIWLSFGSFWSGIKMVEIDSVTGKPADLSMVSLAGRGGGAIEAPFIILKEPYYYLFVSFDACCQGVNSTYNVRVGRSDLVTGPYKDSWNRPMTSGGGTTILSGYDRWKGPGHCAVYQEGDQYWLIYHAYDVQRNGTPVLRINNLAWDDAGWPVVQDTLIVDIETDIPQPDRHRLYQNFPNPFNGPTHIPFDLDREERVTMHIYDMQGQMRACLIDGPMQAGHHEIKFDADQLPSGIYLCSMRTESFHQTRKLILLK